MSTSAPVETSIVPAFQNSSQTTRRRKPRKYNGNIQKKYRARQRESEMKLIERTEFLRKKTACLMKERTELFALNTRVNSILCNNAVPLKFIDDYTSLFKHGITRIMAQKQFIEGVVAPECSYNHLSLRGPALWMEQWHLYTTAHPEIEFCLKEAKMFGSADVVYAHHVVYLTLSQQTIDMLYPSLVHDKQLVDSVIGKKLEMNVWGHFYFMEGVVIRVQAASDLVTAWGRIVDESVSAVKIVNECKFDGLFIDINKKAAIDSKAANLYD